LKALLTSWKWAAADKVAVTRGEWRAEFVACVLRQRGRVLRVGAISGRVLSSHSDRVRSFGSFTSFSPLRFK
jgi:hypothetical protein